jgi:NDP-sugar pyrophosphorylase family protein
LAEEV